MRAHHGVRPELAAQHELVEVDSLRYYPDNARVHDDDLIQESLAVHGQYRTITVQRSTRYVLAGNGTLEQAIALGWTHIAVTWLDVDAAEARKIVAVDNRASDLAHTDAALLHQLLKPLGSDLLGTGYTEQQVIAVAADAAEPLTFPEGGVAAPRVRCPSCGRWMSDHPETENPDD